LLASQPSLSARSLSSPSPPLLSPSLSFYISKESGLTADITIGDRYRILVVAEKKKERWGRNIRFGWYAAHAARARDRSVMGSPRDTLTELSVITRAIGTLGNI